MGLDSYLYGKNYLMRCDEKEAAQAQKVAKVFPKAPGKIEGVTCEVAYWRKANAIHQWFVKNVQDGKDDCGEYYVNRAHIADLMEACKAVLNDRQKCHKILPTQGGFFFGSTDYDGWYFSDIQNTITMLEPLLADDGAIFKDWTFYYHSCW